MQVTVPVEYSIQNILDKFDFEKVQSVMLFLDWKWGKDAPTIPELRAKAEELLTRLDPTTDDSLMTGGFYASVRRGKTISLSFILEHISKDAPVPEVQKPR